MGDRDVPGGIALKARTRGHESGLSKEKGKDLSMDSALDTAICFGRIRTINPVPWRSMRTASWHWYVCPAIWDYCIFSDPLALPNFLPRSLGEGIAPGGGDVLGSARDFNTHTDVLSSAHTWQSPLVCAFFFSGAA